MANLRVDKITSTETFEKTGSVQFDGSTSNIRAGWVDDYNYLHTGTEDWTVECWIYRITTNNRQTIWSTGGNSSVIGMTMRIESGAVGGSNGDAIGIQLSKASDGNWIFWGSGDTKLEASKWHHVAVVFRSSNKSLEIYVDGKLTNGKGDTGTVQGTFSSYSSSNAYSGLILGMEPYGSSLKFNGYLSNFRIIQGTAIYTENFKVPMKELEVTSGTTLLCCQSKYSAAGAKISPFISGVNDGTIWSDAQDVTNGNRLRHTDFGDGSIHDAAKVFDARDDTDAETPNGTGNKLIFDFETLLGKKIPVSSSIKIKIGGSDGRTLKVNGTTIATNAGPTESVITNQSTLNKVEVASEGGARSGRLAYIKVDDVSLTLPVLPFGKVLPSELSPGLLTSVSKNGAGSAITGSVEFNGTGDYLTTHNTTDLRLADSDFTIEFWATTSKTDSSYTAFSLFENSSAIRSYILEVRNNGAVRFEWWYNGSSANSITTGTGAVIVNKWYHYAVSRNGATLRLFINGVEVGSSDVGTNSFYNNTVTPFMIGGMLQSGAHTQKWQGNISNFRVVKGTALYTHDFIPSTRELKKIPGTVLLCCQDPDNPLTEETGKTITPYGNLGDGSLGGELVTNNSVWTLTKGGSGATDWTVSNNGRSLAGTTVTSGYIRATYTLSKGDYLVSLRWTGGAFAVQDSTGYIVATDGSSTAFGTSDDGAYSFYMTDTTSVVITGTTWNQAYTVDDISIKRIYRNNGASNFTPQVGDDRKVTFEGVTKINSDAYFYLPTGDTASRETTGTYNAGTRGIFGGGFSTPTTHHDNIQHINIASTGDAVDAGDLTASRYGNAALSSSTRAVWAGGINPTPSYFSTIDAVEILSKGNAVDFGYLYTPVYYPGGVSNQTRGIWAGGYRFPSPAGFRNEIGYIAIASKGSAEDFGDLTTARNSFSTFGSPTRGCLAGGATPGRVNSIEYVTISSTGNSKDFGDLTVARNYAGGTGSSIRGLMGGGSNPSADNTIDYVTIATTGTAQDFGDLTSARQEIGSCSSATRGIFAGAWSPSKLNTIDFVTIQTTGNATIFGELVNPGVMQEMGTSNGHGGLG